MVTFTFVCVFILCWFDWFCCKFLLSVPVQVMAWRTVSEMADNVSSGMLNLTHSLTHSCRESYNNILLPWPLTQWSLQHSTYGTFFSGHPVCWSPTIYHSSQITHHDNVGHSFIRDTIFRNLWILMFLCREQKFVPTFLGVSSCYLPPKYGRMCLNKAAGA